MMKYLQRLGRSLMLPIAVLPAAALLIGLGRILENIWENSASIASVSGFLVSSGDAILGSMGLLFAVGVAIGLSIDKSGAAGLAGLVGWLVPTTILKPDGVANLLQIEVDSVNVAFNNVGTQFLGIIVGILAATIYNRFNNKYDL